MKITPRASIFAIVFMLSGCVNMPLLSVFNHSERAANHETIIKDDQFIISGTPSKFLYVDRFGSDMAARTKAADTMVAQMTAMRMARQGLGSIYPGDGRKSTVFDRVTGTTTFLIYCNGVCNNTVIKVKSLGGHLLAKISTRRDFPLIEVSNNTLYRAHIEFEVESSVNPSMTKTEITITEFGGSMGLFF